MLVLARRINESIMVGDDVEMTVVDIKGEQVKIGIQAPRSIAVHRKEVYEAIQKENISAAQVKPDHIKGVADLFKPYSKKSNNPGNKKL